MRSFILIVFVLILSVKLSVAQYINVDSLVIVPGEVNGLTLAEVENSGINLSSASYEISSTTGIMLSKFGFPVRNTIISRFGPRHGRMHYGLDIRSATGDTIYAAFDGQILKSGYERGFGNLIVIQHEKDIKTYYGHLSKYLIRAGSWIKKGEALGLAGSTGRATGSHLHFEIREKNHPFDPELVYDFSSDEIREDVESIKSLAELQRRLLPKGYSVNVAIPQYYAVRSGDSLWRISRRYKMSINQICRLNKITENSVLRVGQPLKLY